MGDTRTLFAALGRARRRLEAAGRSAEQVNRELLAEPLSSFEARERSRLWGDPELAATTVEPLIQRVLEWKKELPDLGPGHVFELRALIPTVSREPELRNKPGRPLLGQHPPLDPEFIERALSRFFFWVSGPGYAEIHPLEQTVLCQLRLLEISPFVHHSALVSILFSYYFLVRTDHLLPTFQEEDANLYGEVLLEGLNFSTTRLIEFHLEACLRSYARVQ